MGYETKLTPEVEQRVVEGIVAGQDWLAATQAAGISKRTAFRWMRDGTKQRTGLYHHYVVLVRRAQRKRRRIERQLQERQRAQTFNRLPEPLQALLVDPVELGDLLARIAELPPSGRTRMLSDRLHALAAASLPCPTRDLLDDEDAMDHAIATWSIREWGDVDSTILRRRIAEMRAAGELDDAGDDADADGTAGDPVGEKSAEDAEREAQRQRAIAALLDRVRA